MSFLQHHIQIYMVSMPTYVAATPDLPLLLREGGGEEKRPTVCNDRGKECCMYIHTHKFSVAALPFYPYVTDTWVCSQIY